MHSRCAMALATLAVLAVAPRVHAGGAAIPATPGVDVTTPREHALIAHRGGEQTLLWTVTLRASQPTTVVYVLPLPGEAVIDPVPAERFVAIADALGRTAGDDAPTTLAPTVAPGRPAAVEITSPVELLSWIHRRVVATGVEKSYLPAGLRERLERAITVDGARWFLFFHVVVGPEARAVAPLRIHCRTLPGLRLPFALGAVQSGRTDVALTVVSPRRFARFTGLSFGRVERLADRRSATARIGDARPLLAPAGWPPSIRVRRWRLRATLASIDRDLRAH